jgi:NAD(P)-dependent dehydrogenase (short-subunit alcohol dehydrogenase family)
VKRAAMSATSRGNLEGQRPLSRGAPFGIGRAVALQPARDGAEVVVHRLPEDRGRLRPDRHEVL